MKQYKITSDNIAPIDSEDDCYLAKDDPAQEIKRLQFLGGLGGEERLAEYRSKQLTTENIHGHEFFRSRCVKHQRGPASQLVADEYGCPR